MSDTCEFKYPYGDKCEFASPPGKKLCFIHVEVDQTNPKDLLGAKKLDLTLLPMTAWAHANRAMFNGSEKYGPYNWRDKKVRAKVYVTAAMRHLASWFEREEMAEDSGAHHLGHAMACCAIILDAQETGNLVDDRPEGGAAFHELMKRLNDEIKARAK